MKCFTIYRQSLIVLAATFIFFGVPTSGRAHCTRIAETRFKPAGQCSWETPLENPFTDLGKLPVPFVVGSTAGTAVSGVVAGSDWIVDVADTNSEAVFMNFDAVRSANVPGFVQTPDWTITKGP